MKIWKILWLSITLPLLDAILTACSNENKTKDDKTPHIGIPSIMQPNTIMVYDNNLNPIYVQGGQLSDEQKSKIEPELLGDTSSEGTYAKPGIKVEYTSMVRYKTYIIHRQIHLEHISYQTQIQMNFPSMLVALF